MTEQITKTQKVLKFLDRFSDAYEKVGEDGTLLEIVASRFFLVGLLFLSFATIVIGGSYLVVFSLTQFPDLIIGIGVLLFAYGAWVSYKMMALK